MAEVKFTTPLRHFFPTLKDGIKVEADTVAQLITALDKVYPGFADYVVDERGRLRKHVNIFIGEDMIEDREALQDTVTDKDRVFIFQALSGG